MFETYELWGLLACVGLSGFYSGSEAMLLSVGIDRARQMMEEFEGGKGESMGFMVKKSSEILATILVGNNIVNILAASLATTMASKYFKSDAIGISVGITTVVILIFGEIIPKTFARVHAEFLAPYIVRILQLNYYLFYPVVATISFITRKVLGENAELTGRLVTKNDIEYLVGKAEKENTIDSKQLGLLNSILEFPTIKVKDIMVPRVQVKYLSVDKTLEEIVEYLRNNTHSRYPVCHRDLDDAIGFLHAKDLIFVKWERPKDFNIKKYLKAPFFVYEHMKIQSVFDHMNRRKIHLALVKDENGLVVGIVTLEDIVEEIVGEIQDEHDIDELNIHSNGKKFNLREGIVVDGAISLRDLYNEYDIKIPLNDNYSTLAGLLLDMLGNKFPDPGQVIIWEGLCFELEKVKKHLIEKVRIYDVDGENHLFPK